MNTNGLARQYGQLTPEERFRLIYAASGRGDEAERERLARAGRPLTLTMPDHAPYAYAFQDLDHLIFMELLETAARYFDGLALFRGETRGDGADDADSEAEEPDSGEADDATEAEATEEETEEVTAADLDWGLVLATGFILQTKADGWKLFCERLNVPPFLSWGLFPGFPRLQRALAFVAGSDALPGPAFVAEGMVRFFNRIRPAGAPEVTAEGLMTAEKIADDLEEMYRIRAKWWGG